MMTPMRSLAGRVTGVIHHLDPDDLEASRANIVFEFGPESGA